VRGNGGEIHMQPEILWSQFTWGFLTKTTDKKSFPIVKDHVYSKVGGTVR